MRGVSVCCCCELGCLCRLVLVCCFELLHVLCCVCVAVRVALCCVGLWCGVLFVLCVVWCGVVLMVLCYVVAFGVVW